ncbi:solute carrier family 22 member 7 isoform X1 [Gracilinanus agilis]|uniref:solute carrier family 22 member 7 isoform X1 n=1 Tax=Gracilinanus agilis TaxID=191870 RepID=UPI001CFE0E15|nr:solute carrier family 22 member 7 isoform X1 [Gracilinanus agilis]
MGFEELLKEVGGYGRFQIRNVLLLVLPRLLLPMNFLLPIFVAAVPTHHCALPAQDPLDNFTQESAWLEAYLPRELDGSLSSCYRYLYPHYPNTTREEQEDHIVPCPDGWRYDQSQFYSTIATQWDLVCERKGLNRVISTFFFIGVLVGAVIFGYLSDRFGRRPLLLVAYVSSLVLGLISVISVSYIMFVITRTLTGVALAGFTIIVLPLELEWLDVGHRTMAGILASTFWSVGVMLLALIGYLIRDWRWLLLAVTLPCVPGILSLWWVPESARWLMTQGRVKEAQHYLLQCAALNGRPQARNRLSTEALSLVAEGEKMVRRPSYLDLFRTPRLRHISLCCMVVWFGVNFSYYGLSLDLSGLGLNLYQIQLLFGVVEIPSKMIVYLSVRYAGRRLTEVGALLGTALTVGASLLLPSGLGTWRLVLGVAGKGFSEAAFTTAYLFTSELYPTVLRQTGLGLTALVGRLGGSLAPLATLLEGTWSPLPKVTYGGIALVASATALLLPETRHAELPETIQDVEKKRTLKGPQEEGTPMKVIRD